MLNADSFLQNLSDRIDGFMYSCMNDANYTMTYLSNGFERLLGYGIQRFLDGGSNYASLIHPEDVPAVDEAVASALRAGGRWQISYRVKTSDDGWKHVLESGGGRAGEAGEVTHLDGIVIDFERANDLAIRLDAGHQALGAIGTASERIVALLRSLRMLALNARIEAARSGQAGLGFAVVAREMGQLATNGDELTHLIDEELKRLRAALQI